MDKSLPQHRYSIIRSSHRAEFSKSGDGGSTTATKNNLTNKLTWKNAEGSSLTRNYTNDVLLLEPKEKLRSLAMQLGESCIATGLAALINQKRDLELGKLKKNNSNNCFSNGVSCSSSQKSPKMNKYIQKLKSNNSNCNINFNNINEDMSYDLASNNNNENKGGNNLSKYDSKRSSKNFCNKSDNCLIENSNNIIKSLNFGNNNVDAYINIDSSIDDQTRINVATNSLSLSQLKSLTPYYSITIKNKNETKKYNNIASILSIDLVDPFEIKRENENYEIVTSGYAHPSYASPVMKDIFKFSYDASTEISDEFLTWFDGCNIILKDIDYINQTWMKKVIDIDNIMKSTDKDASTMIIKKDTSYEIKMIPDPDNDDDKKCRYPKSATKILQMLKGYRDGFVSFWQ